MKNAGFHRRRPRRSSASSVAASTRGPPGPAGLPFRLKPAQETAFAALASGSRREITRADYQRITDVSRSQAAYDLADLVRTGILERVGSGRTTRYRLSRSRASGKRRWTDERILAELTEFCEGRREWPAAREFRDAGRGDLYLAASRYGGIDYWAAELGFPHRAAPAEEPAEGYVFGKRRRHLVALAGLGALAGLLAGVLQLAFGGRSPADVPVPRFASTDAVPARPSAPAGVGAAPPTAKKPAAQTVKQSARSVLLLTAARGASWLRVRSGSATGELLYEGTLARGKRLELTGRQLWIRLGAPANLRAKLNGRQLALPKRTATVVVTRRGLRIEPPTSRPAPSPEAVLVQTEKPAATSTRQTFESSTRPTPDPAPQPPPGPSPDPAPSPP